MRGPAFILTILLLGSAHCARPIPPLLEPADPPIEWPKPPDVPRVRSLGDIFSSEQLGVQKSLAQSWDEILHGPTPPLQFATPHAVAVNADGRRVAVADTNGKCVHLLDVGARTWERRFQCGGEDAVLECPVGVVWINDALFVVDSVLHAVVRYAAGESGTVFGRDHLTRPAGLAYNEKSGELIVSDAAANTLVVFTGDGVFVRTIGAAGSSPGAFNRPSHLACAADGTIVVADSLNFRIQRLASDGAPLSEFGRKGDAGGDLAMPKGVAIDASGNIWVVDAQFENVQAFTPNGELLLAIGGEGRGPGEFWLPAGICIDKRNRLWVADTYNRRLQVFELLQQLES